MKLPCSDGGSSPVHLKGLWRRRPRQLHAIGSLDHELMDLLKAGARGPGRFGHQPVVDDSANG